MQHLLLCLDDSAQAAQAADAALSRLPLAAGTRGRLGQRPALAAFGAQAQ